VYEELRARLAAIGEPLDDGVGPVISNFPIWLAETQGTRGLALPNEPPVAVLDLARTFGATRLVIVGVEHGQWPGVLSTDVPGTACFEGLDLGAGPSDHADPLANVHVYEITCR
jgi:hypothetical protein